MFPDHFQLASSCELTRSACTSQILLWRETNSFPHACMLEHVTQSKVCEGTIKTVRTAIPNYIPLHCNPEGLRDRALEVEWHAEVSVHDTDIKQNIIS